MFDIIPQFHDAAATYLFFAFCAFAGINLLYTLLVFGRFSFHSLKKEQTNNEKLPVSVIIAARNESQNLYHHLPLILEQDYPNYEVIVINHQSIDDSQYILDAFSQQYKHLKIVKVEQSKHLKYGKKLPLTIGIKGAKYDHLLFTDADCKPASDQWISSMSKFFSKKKQIVLGYGPYTKEKGLLNKVIRFDAAWIAMNYFSFAKIGLPYMGIGRNLAYTKKAFVNADGFKSHYALSSGDDDLFIQDAAKNKNYCINIESNSFCYSKGAEEWKKWFKQKSRHYTTSERYGVIKKLMLGIYPLSMLIMTTSFVILIFDSNFKWVTALTFSSIALIKWFVIGRSFKRLHESKFIVLLPLLDVLYSFLTPLMFYSVDKTDSKKW
jgi:glycosyltransferase involved in cell wall biosynthesis